MGDVLIYGDTVRSPELRHEVPLLVPDGFLYAEAGGARHLAVSSMEIPRLREVGDYELHPLEEFGLDELVASGRTLAEVEREIAVRAVVALGVEHAVVPGSFSLGLADGLRDRGVFLEVDQELFDARRRVKNARELVGVRRAQTAAEAGMAATVELLRRAEPCGGAVVLDGEPLTSERLKLAIDTAFLAHGCVADEFVVAHGPQSAVGHEMGSGAILAGEPIVIDIWPRDKQSSCFADMTRTFVVGEPSEELVEWHRLTLEALERALADVRPGADANAIFAGTCELYEAAGYPTQRTKKPGETLADGFHHALGHGVGLDVHEAPILGRIAGDRLVAGDVITLEPGLYRQGVGGCRLEDLVLVTEEGSENLTRFTYDLRP